MAIVSKDVCSDVWKVPGDLVTVCQFFVCVSPISYEVKCSGDFRLGGHTIFTPVSTC